MLGFLSYADGGSVTLHPYAKQLLRNSFEWPIKELVFSPVRRDDGQQPPAYDQAQNQRTKQTGGVPERIEISVAVINAGNNQAIR